MKRHVGIRTLYALLSKTEVNEPVCMNPTESLYNKKSMVLCGKASGRSASLTVNAKSLAADNEYTDCCKRSKYLLTDFSKSVNKRGKNGWILCC